MNKYLILLLLCAPCFAANHYVWCGAAGAGTGADFTNAKTDLPASGTMIRGDTYIVAGSVSCTYAAYVFNDTESGTTVITVRKAVSATDSGVAGWQSSFATAVAEWTEPDKSNQMDATGLSLWRFCRGYYTLDGMTGNTNPLSGAIAGQGFLLQSRNRLIQGIINGGNSCSQTAYSNLSFQHLEVNGVDRWVPSAVVSCSFSAGTATVTTAVNTYTWTVGNVIGGFTALFGGVVFGAAGTTTLATVSGQDITFAVASDPCPTTNFIGFDFGGASAFKLASGTTDTFSNVTISNSYIHNSQNNNLITTTGVPNFVISNNYLSNNGGNNLQHSNSFVDHASTSFGGAQSSNVTVANNYFVDVQGTSAVTVFNNTSTFSGIAADDSWSVYGNVFATQAAPSTLVNSQWISCFGVPAAKVSCSHWKIYNNTVYNMSDTQSNSRVSWLESDPSSIDIEVYDNLLLLGNDAQPSVSTGAVCYDETAGCAATAQIIQDYNYYSQITGPTASDVHGQFTGANPFVNAGVNNFELTGSTSDGLHLSAPYNVDPLGFTRGADGVWDRGAYEFQSAGMSFGSGFSIGSGIAF